MICSPAETASNKPFHHGRSDGNDAEGIRYLRPQVPEVKPSQATAEFGGTWGAYPWFRSGNIIHGDDIQGLFVVKIDAMPSSTKARSTAFQSTLVSLGQDRISLNLAGTGPFELAAYSLDGRQ